MGRNEFPVQTVADISHVLAFGPMKVEKTHEFISNHLLPVLKAKIDYASV